MRRIVRLALVPVLALSGSIWLAGCGGSASSLKEAWKPTNDPLNLGGDFNRLLSALPLTGDADQKPWTDTYWPSYQGGIANRWNDPAHPSAFSMHIYTQAEVAALPMQELAKLSPAEKYDLFVGDYQWPLTYIQRTTHSVNDPLWFGYCHGWAPAAINFKEPKPVTLANPQGIQVPFGSSDIKALLTYSQQYHRVPADLHVLGTRCNVDLHADPAHANNPECTDTNAGAFHVALANLIGIKKKALIADVSRDLQIWNQPVFGFTSTIVSQAAPVYPSAASGTTRVVEIKTTMRYISEFGPRWNASPFDTFPAQIAERHYHYTVELNSAGEIIGGDWADADRPDFLWTEAPPSFPAAEFLAKVPDIYAAATAP